MTGHTATAVLLPVGARATVDQPFAAGLHEAQLRRPELVVLSADLSKYTDVAPFAESSPDRFIQVGMAEANMMGIAGGLGRTGMRPVAVTYCVFAARRAYEQVAMALATGGPGAVVVAFLPGITTPFTATHQGTDDLALMRQIPGMTVIDPMDATEFRLATIWAVEHDGPVYLRGLRGSVMALLDPARTAFDPSRPLLIAEGADVGVIGTGLGTAWAVEAAELSGVAAPVSLLHAPVLAPFPTAAVADFIARHRVVVTVENHNRSGGLGSAVAEVIADLGLGTRLHRCGIPDEWAGAGSYDYLRRRHRCDAASLAALFTSLSNPPANGAGAVAGPRLGMTGGSGMVAANG